ADDKEVREDERTSERSSEVVLSKHAAFLGGMVQLQNAEEGHHADGKRGHAHDEVALRDGAIRPEQRAGEGSNDQDGCELKQRHFVLPAATRSMRGPIVTACAASANVRYLTPREAGGLEALL